MSDLAGAADKIDHNEQETFYMKGLYFPAQTYNFSCFRSSRNVIKWDFLLMGTG
jgi:hypothetical protein